MTLFEVGRLAVKIAGRDAGKTCVIIDVLEEPFVLVDGQTRRRKCNNKHLEPLDQVIKLKKNASHAEVKAEFKKLGLDVLETKPKEAKEKPKKQRKEKTFESKEERKKQIGINKKKTAEKKEEIRAEPTSFEKTLERESKKKE